MTTFTSDIYRLDPLTGCHNFLSFIETLDQLSTQKGRQPFSILYVDLNYLALLNEQKGHAYGDTVIHWAGIALREECASPVFRTGGDDFAVILTGGTHTEYERQLNRLFNRLNREGEQLGIPSPPAGMALIHFDSARELTPNDVMFHLWEAILDVKSSKDRTINIFSAGNLIRATGQLKEQSQEKARRSVSVLRHIANQAIYRVIQMGQVIDVWQKASYLDPISGLPNMRAALLKIEQQLSEKTLFSIMLMDGDGLTRYNNISYAAGDEMIQRISAILSEKLRPGDFVARWRTGDEFLAILPGTPIAAAEVVGNRVCGAIREASKTWQYPTSITIGIASYPIHGTNADALVEIAEGALKKGKQTGKDKVILAGG
ncbi:MAG: GGDEF domain-containing protein [Anaerolineales bacterium]|nr:GGDEF domain-containing protein [Anaerolineales bacterium]